MSNIEEQFAKTLFRAACPDTLELGEYHLGMVQADRQSWIQFHLSECRFCAAEIAQLKGYLADLKPELELSLAERAGSRIQTWIARLLPDSNHSDALTSFAGLALRGERGEGSDLLSYEAGDAQLHLQIQVDPSQAGRRILLGLLIGLDPRGAQAHLVCGGEEVQSAALDELSNFTFTGVLPDAYSLLVRGPEFEILLDNLPVF